MECYRQRKKGGKPFGFSSFFLRDPRPGKAHPRCNFHGQREAGNIPPVCPQELFYGIPTQKSSITFRSRSATRSFAPATGSPRSLSPGGKGGGERGHLFCVWGARALSVRSGWLCPAGQNTRECAPPNTEQGRRICAKPNGNHRQGKGEL